jgi:nucleotide-binding universal stress UspA family protein
MDQVTTELRPGTEDGSTRPASLENFDERPITVANHSSTPLRTTHPLDARKNAEFLIRRILVPTDFSPASARALERAKAIANQCDASLTILHVIDINASVGSGTAEGLMRGLWSDAGTQMAKLAVSLAGTVEAQTLLAEGLPSEVILEQSLEFDLVIMGRDRHQRKWQLFSKHTGKRVIENSVCPVMVVQSDC